jgi:MFS family permease
MSEPAPATDEGEPDRSAIAGERVDDLDANGSAADEAGTHELTADGSAARRRAGAVPLRRNANWRLLWVGQLLSDLGSQFGVLAYPLLVRSLSGSTAIAGAVATITSVAAFCVRLPAGALADRLDRRRTMMVTDGVRAVVLALLAAGLAVGWVSWEFVLVVALIDRLGDVLFTPSLTATIPLIVPDAQLEDAWASTEARQFGAGIVGQSLGGLLFQLGRAVPFLGDAISYGVSTVTSARLRGEFRPPQPEGKRPGLWQEAFEGIRAIMRSPLLRAVIVQAPLINFMFTGVIITVTLGLAASGVRSTVIGLVQASILVGGLLGAIVAPRLTGRFRLSRLVVALTGLGAVAVMIAAFVMPSAWIAVPVAVPFFLSPIANAALFAAMFRETPPELQGRVNAAVLLLATGLAALSPLVAGLLIQHVSAGFSMAFFGCGLAVCCALALVLKGLRQAEAARADT